VGQRRDNRIYTRPSQQRFGSQEVMPRDSCSPAALDAAVAVGVDRAVCRTAASDEYEEVVRVGLTLGLLAFADVEAVEREVHGGDQADNWQKTITDCERRTSCRAVWADDEGILAKSDQ
jgi:hypothetical protein